MNYNGFEYNEFGVCTNSEIAYQFDKRNDFSFEIKVAETPQGWVYGYYYSFLLTAGLKGCWLDSTEICPTKSEAIVLAANCLKELISDKPKYSKANEELDNIITKEIKPKSQPRQMTIFDYL